ncbi:MAG: hypothetical protein FWE31_03850 [Firmicutes bacterium]|nr:hypothetical protein [Bacillota bacterium]
MEIKHYRSPVVEALYNKYGKDAMECGPVQDAEELSLGHKQPAARETDSFIPKGAGYKLFSMAIMAFAILYTMGAAVGVVISHQVSGPVYAGAGSGSSGSGITVTVLVFSIIAAFALGGFLTSVFLGGGFKFKRKEQAEVQVQEAA